jgi:hypothetical protein
VKVIDANRDSSSQISLGSCDDLVYSAGNPEEVNPDNTSSVLISVEGGMPPFTWTAGGDGFSFEETTTTGTSNILYVEEDACGAGTIIVRCPCGQVVGGSIRSTRGEWGIVDHCQSGPIDGGRYQWYDWCNAMYYQSPMVRVSIFKASAAVYSEPDSWGTVCPDIPESCEPTNSYDKTYIHTFTEVHWVCEGESE